MNNIFSISQNNPTRNLLLLSAIFLFLIYQIEGFCHHCLHSNYRGVVVRLRSERRGGSLSGSLGRRDSRPVTSTPSSSSAHRQHRKTPNSSVRNSTSNHSSTHVQAHESSGTPPKAETAVAVYGLGRSLEHSPALVLNADYQPLSFLPLSLWAWQDAMRAVLSEKASVISEYEDLSIRSLSFTMKLPSVIVLRHYFHHQNFVPFVTQKYVFLRDDYSCQYCGKRFPSSKLSIDHVVPRKAGGKTVWSNVVTACCPCNQRKGCLSLQELPAIGMRLRKTPHIPSMSELQMKCRQHRRPFLHNPDQLRTDKPSTASSSADEAEILGLDEHESEGMRGFRYHPHWLQFL